MFPRVVEMTPTPAMSGLASAMSLANVAFSLAFRLMPGSSTLRLPPSIASSICLDHCVSAFGLR